MDVSLGEVSAGVVEIDTKKHMCVVGEGSSSTQCYRFDGDDDGDEDAKRRWSSGPQRPCVANHHCTVNHANKLFLIGGLGGCERAFQVFDGDAWKELPSLPWNSGSGSCAYRDGHIMLCGGIDGKRTHRKCATYNIHVGKWSEKGTLEYGINHAGYCNSGDKMYMIGGRGGGNVVGRALSACQYVNLKTKKSHRCKGLPYATGGVGKCVAASGGLWMFGGELNHEQFRQYGESVGGKEGGAGGVLKAVWYYNGSKWSPKPGLKVGKHGILPVAHQGYVYIAGGGTEAGASKSKSLHRAKLTTLKKCSGK